MYSLYLVTDDLYLENLPRKIEEAIQGGVTLVQLRLKNISARKIYQVGVEVHRVTKEYNVPLVIDDRLDIAMALDAEGVHLGQSDLSIDIAKRLWQADKIYGATAKTVEQAMLAEKMGATYLGVGAIFPTNTKVVTQRTEISTLQAIIENVSIPVVAIGGIKHDNIHALNGQKIDGVAVVSAILASSKIKDAAAELKMDVDRIKSLSI